MRGMRGREYKPGGYGPPRGPCAEAGRSKSISSKKEEYDLVERMRGELFNYCEVHMTAM